MNFEIINQWLSTIGFSEGIVDKLSLAINVALILLISYIAYAIARIVINKAIYRLLKKAPERWYKALVNSGFFKRCANLAPVLIINASVPIVFVDKFSSWQSPLKTAVAIYLTWVMTSILIALTNVIAIVYEYSNKAKEVPLTGVIQVVKLVLVLMAIIITVAILMNQSPLYLLSGFGAMTAILMVIFKDTLMGFVAGVQLAANRMVAIDDWIQVPDSNADGVIKEVGLITIKVENWDNTTVYLPTYVLVHQSFTNWQGMIKSGGRRMMRAIKLDLDSARLLDKDELAKLTERYFQQDVEDWLKEHQLDAPVSNLTTIRLYATHYLAHHPNIRQDMMYMTRLLEPTAAGLPLQLYGFSKKTQWNEYETVQSEITEHLYTVLPDFGLRYYQYFAKELTGSQTDGG
ncbi:mechanosensitive ion channel family protein [Idiomarina seosinensis]|uniref:mechanosensitive ion channel family protein n=1 Tax=Idiomarina seosinensis TaxID=281739 RepID=UPI00384B21C8